MTRENEEMLSVPQQAARWWRVMRDAEPTAAEKREFADWVCQAPERIEAMLRMARAHKALLHPEVRWPDTAAETLIREAKATPEEIVPPLLRPPRTPARESPRWPARSFAFGLAVVVLLAVCASWLTLSRPEQFQTNVGEQRSVMLGDGSRVTLNTASRVEVRLRANRRIVDLVSGEAIFDVAHDAHRPFDVRVGPVRVRAVGTQFEVDRRATRTVVTVIEGRVSVTGADAERTRLLSVGDRVVIDSAGPGPIEKGVNLSDATAWTQRQLVFRHRPLGEIAEEFNRYNLTRVEIRSQALQTQEVTGIFRTDDVASFVALLAGKQGVHVTSNSAGGYVVTSDEPAAAQK